MLCLLITTDIYIITQQTFHLKMLVASCSTLEQHPFCHEAKQEKWASVLISLSWMSIRLLFLHKITESSKSHDIRWKTMIPNLTKHFKLDAEHNLISSASSRNFFLHFYFHILCMLKLNMKFWSFSITISSQVLSFMCINHYHDL